MNFKICKTIKISVLITRSSSSSSKEVEYLSRGSNIMHEISNDDITHYLRVSQPPQQKMHLGTKILVMMRGFGSIVEKDPEVNENFEVGYYVKQE